MEIQWFGTASIKITADKQSIVFDPFISMNDEIRCATVEDYTGATDIFITHGHFDHIMNIPEIWHVSRCTIYCGVQVAEVLLSYGISPDYIRVIQHGHILSIPPFVIKIYESTHVHFDIPLIVKTLFNKRIISNINNFKKILSLHKTMPMGNVFAYEVLHDDKNILHFGSLNVSNNIQYPNKPTMLTIPFQGRSDIHTYAIDFIKRFIPRTVFLHHFDDTFPPISQHVGTELFVEKMTALFPDITIIIPQYGIPYAV